MGTSKVQTLLVSMDVESAELQNGLKQARAAINTWGAGFDAAMKKAAAAFAGIEKTFSGLKRVSNDVAQLSGVVVAMGGASLKLASELDGGVKSAMDGMTLATKQLAVPVAQMLIPAVREVTKDIQSMALWVSSLDPATKSHVSTVAKWAVELGGLAFIVSKASGLLGSLAKVVQGAVVALSAIGIGPILAIGALIVLVAGLHKVWRENWGGIQEITAKVAEWFASTWDEVFARMKRGFGTVVKFFAAAAKLMLDAQMAVAAYDMTPEQRRWLKFGTEQTKSAIDAMADDIGSNPGKYVAAGLDLGKELGGSLVKGVVKELDLMTKPLQDKLKQIFDTKGGTLVSGVQTTGLDDFLKKGSQGAAVGGAAGVGLANLLKKASGGAVKGGSVAFIPEKIAEPLYDLAGIFKQGGSKILDALGSFGSLIKSASAGFDQGGPLGAVVNVLIDIALQTTAVLNLVEIAIGSVNVVVQALSPALEGLLRPVSKVIAVVMNVLVPIFEILGPVFDYWGTLLGTVANFLQPIIAVLKFVSGALRGAYETLKNLFLGALLPVIKVIYFLFKSLFWGLLKMVQGLAWLWNQFVLAMANATTTVLNAITGGLAQEWVASVGSTIMALAVNLTPIDDAVKGLEGLDFDAATRETDRMAGAARAAGRGTETLTKTVERLNDSLTNIPRGFRVAAARYAAQGGSGSKLDAALGGGINVSVYVGGRQVAAEVERQWNRMSFDRTGRRPPRGG